MKVEDIHPGRVYRSHCGNERKVITIRSVSFNGRSIGRILVYTPKHLGQWGGPECYVESRPSSFAKWAVDKVVQT